jgi:hypothetical protein
MIILEMLLVAAVATGALAVFVLQRAGKLSPRTLNVLTAIAAGALAVMIITDWPTKLASSFWAQHSVLTDALSAVLLGGTIYLAFEARENQKQEELGASLAATAYAGVVDHVVDLDLALAYMMRAEAAPIADWEVPQKPLRWMRDPQAQKDRSNPTGVRSDVAGLRLHTPLQNDERERVVLLIDQSLRRLMAAMRDWAPLFTAGRDGRAVLVRLGHLRKRLLQLEGALEQRRAEHLWTAMRTECHVLALGLELASGAPTLRPEVFEALPGGLRETEEWHKYRSAAATLTTRELTAQELAAIRRELGRSTAPPIPGAVS